MKKVGVVVFIVTSIIFLLPTISVAESIGGEVTTPGKITFEVEKGEVVPPPKIVDPIRQLPDTFKKVLPQTGESQKVSTVLTMVGISLVYVLFLLKKRMVANYDA